MQGPLPSNCNIGPHSPTNKRMEQPQDSKPIYLLFQDCYDELKQKAAMCEEEWRIRGELETEIERDLEQEIKDGIYHLAFRLHRLYQHKRERNSDITLSEVNISIKMEGGTRIEIKETKKDEPLRPRTRSSRSKDVKGKSNAKRFDWAKSLRAGADPSILNRTSERSYQPKVSSNDHNTRRNNKLLELGWKQ